MIRIFLLIILCCVHVCSSAQQSSKPNILFILVDDFGADDCNFAGSTFYETPNIDRLAAKSTVFNRGYAAASVCSPSRASIFTGVYTPRHGITDYIGAATGEDWRKMNRFSKLLPPLYANKLPDNLTTMPQALQKNGYRTFFAGKWHLGGEKQNAMPTDKGFDINMGGHEVGGPYTNGYFSPFKNPYMTDSASEKGMSYAMKLAKETVHFMQKNKDNAFFACLSFYEVHAPIQSTKARWKKYRDKAALQGISENGFEPSDLLPRRKYQDNPVYAGLVEQMDEAVGYLLASLEKMGLDSSTIVVFTSDNGGVTSGDNYSTAPLHYRGGKGMQWEGGTRVPFVIFVPWLKQVAVCSERVSGIDLMPTILALTHAEKNIQQKTDGINLTGLLQGEKTPGRPLYWHYPHYGNQGGRPSSIIIKNNWKLIHYWETGQEELYNLVADSFENTNLISSQKKLATRLHNQLFVWLKNVNATLPTPDPQYTEEKFAKWKENIHNNMWPGLEKKRKEMLQPGWQPNTNWWGSE